MDNTVLLKKYAISFSLLYPGWLYPGTDIFEPGYQKHKEYHTEYILNSIREIEGVRIVNVITPTEPYGETDRVGIRVKYTPHYKELVSYLSI